MGLFGGSDKQETEFSKQETIQRQPALQFDLRSPFLNLGVSPSDINVGLRPRLDAEQLALQRLQGNRGEQVFDVARTLLAPNSPYLDAITAPLAQQRDATLGSLSRAFSRRNIFGSLAGNALAEQRRRFNEQINRARTTGQVALTSTGLQAAQQAGILSNAAANILAQRINRELGLANLGLRGLQLSLSNQLPIGSVSQGQQTTETSTDPGLLGALGGIADIASVAVPLIGGGFGGGFGGIAGGSGFTNPSALGLTPTGTFGRPFGF